MNYRNVCEDGQVVSSSPHIIYQCAFLLHPPGQKSNKHSHDPNSDVTVMYHVANKKTSDLYSDRNVEVLSHACLFSLHHSLGD